MNVHPIRIIKTILFSMIVTLPFVILAVFSSGFVSWMFLFSIGVGFPLTYIMITGRRKIAVVSQPVVPASISESVDSLVYTISPFVPFWGIQSTEKSPSPDSTLKNKPSELIRGILLLEIQRSTQISSSVTRFDFALASRPPKRIGVGFLAQGLPLTRPFMIEKVDPELVLNGAKSCVVIALVAPLVIFAVGYFYDAWPFVIGLSIFFILVLTGRAGLLLRQALRAKGMSKRLNLNHSFLLSHEGGWIARALGWLTPTTLTDDVARRIDAYFDGSRSETMIYFSAGADRLVLLLELGQEALPTSQILSILTT